MTPAAAQTRRKTRENAFPFDLGKKGRKTGIEVPDTGVRDEHGLETLDHLFSSPEKPARSPAKEAAFKTNGFSKNVDATLSSESDMEMGESTIPEPTAVLTERRKSAIRMPPPKSKSPMKTFLQSPARRHPSLGPVSSPTRGSIVSPMRSQQPQSVKRILDFSHEPHRSGEASNPRGPPQKKSKQAGTSNNSAGSKLSNDRRPSPRNLQPPIEFNSTASARQIHDVTIQDEGEDSYQIMDAGDENDETELEDITEDPLPPESPEILVSKARKRKRASFTTTAAVKKGKGRPPRRSTEAIVEERPEILEEEQEPEHQSIEEYAEEAAAVAAASPPKRRKGRPKGNTNLSKKKPVVKSLGSKQKPAATHRLSPPNEIHRGPPRPRNNNGLYSLRRGTDDLVAQTRSGRHVVKPIEYWKGERLVYDDSAVQDGKGKILLPSIKEVYRAEPVELEKRSRTRRTTTKKPKRATSFEEQEEDGTDEEDLKEVWELEPGRIVGSIRTWDPDDYTGYDAELVQEEIALSAEAIVTTEIPGATVRFAKTLTKPFFGSGMVDLPPGGKKRPKNSRKMHMVFFVFTGRVLVTVNDNSFRIGKGGMWQVPRGNFYSIENDYEKDARIFFSQGCEVLTSPSG